MATVHTKSYIADSLVEVTATGALGDKIVQTCGTVIDLVLLFARINEARVALANARSHTFPGHSQEVAWKEANRLLDEVGMTVFEMDVLMNTPLLIEQFQPS